jgi:hypothetical protein
MTLSERIADAIKAELSTCKGEVLALVKEHLAEIKAELKAEIIEELKEFPTQSLGQMKNEILAELTKPTTPAE